MANVKKAEVRRSKSYKGAFIFGSWKSRNAAGQKSKETSPLANEEKKYLSIVMPPAFSSSSFATLNSSSTSNSPRDDETPPPLPPQSPRTKVEEFEEINFWCPRCGKRMHEPRLLPCLHSMCKKCVEELTSEENQENQVLSSCEESFSRDRRNAELCPICDFPLPTPGSSTIPPPHYSLQHKLVLYALQRRLSHRTVCCDNCPDEVQATLHCSKCLCNFCSDCGVEHEEEESRRLEARPHKVRPIWEAKKVRRVAVCLAHPSHPLRFHCIACQQVTCRECMWRGAHRGHASEDAAGAAKRAISQLTETIRNAKILLNSLLIEYNEQVFLTCTLDRSYTVHAVKRDKYAKDDRNDGRHGIFHGRSRSATSWHSREARERIQEYYRLKKARYLIDAISLCEDLLANGTDVEILSLSRTILKRLKSLGVIIEQRHQKSPASESNDEPKKYFPRPMHTGIYHCCTFCSSGGRKEATCACGGTMPGGYKGCGHGHPGHSGLSHWSCCGSICRNGYCLAARKCAYRVILL